MQHIPRPDRLFQQIRSRQSKSDIDLAILNDLMIEYDLQLIGKPAVPGGRGRSGTLIIDTDQGKKILKKYKATVTDPMVEHEHSILRYLEGTQIPAPRLHPSPSGNTHITLGSGNYALYEFINHGSHYHNYIQTPLNERKFISTAAAKLAELHKVLSDFTPSGYNPNGFNQQTGQRIRDIYWYLKKLEFNQKQDLNMYKDNSRKYLQEFASISITVRDSLIEIGEQLHDSDLPRLIIHGDYGPYNILFHGDNLIGILDFETARLDWRITDLIYAFPRFARTRFGFQSNKVRCFLDSYSKVSLITEDELQLVPKIWKYFRLKRFIICWNRFFDYYSTEWLKLAQENLQQADGMSTRKFVDTLITG